MKKDENKSPKSQGKMSKRMKILIPIICAVVVAAGCVAGILVYNLGMKKAELPDIGKITQDMNNDSSVTNIAVNNEHYKVTVKELDILPETAVEDGNLYTFDATVTREGEIYAVDPIKFSVIYTKYGDEYFYTSAAPNTTELTFSPVAGIEKEKAEKKLSKKYKGIKFKEQKTDLEKKIDKVYFTVDNKEYEGTAFVLYKFNSKKGWLYDKINDKKVNFKKGVTHRENGLYTNTNIRNILLLGIDSFSGDGRSDVMMLTSIDNNTGSIKQTSFMRDNWFNIPGYGYDKLNAAYAYGGAELTVKTIEQTFGIKIDNYAAVNFSTFRDIINTLGGVDVDITSDEAGYINWQINQNGQASSVGLIDETGGKTHLNGQQALWLCRDRGGNGFSGDDFMRTGRQRRVIQSIFGTYSNYAPSKVLAVINTLKGKVVTNMTADDIKWFAERSPRFFTYKFSERCVPTDGEWQAGYSDGGAWIIDLYDFEALKSDIQKRIYEDLK